MSNGIRATVGRSTQRGRWSCLLALFLLAGSARQSAAQTPITFRPPITDERPAIGILGPADWDGDGRIDLVTGDYGAGASVSVFLSNGDGTFRPAVAFTSGANPSAVTTADLNADGRADILVTNQFGDNVTVLLSTSD